jgi:hypothetical protein
MLLGLIVLAATTLVLSAGSGEKSAQGHENGVIAAVGPPVPAAVAPASRGEDLALPALLSVHVDASVSLFDPRDGAVHGPFHSAWTGSGFFINPDGWAITAAHVVAPSDAELVAAVAPAYREELRANEPVESAAAGDDTDLQRIIDEARPVDAQILVRVVHPNRDPGLVPGGGLPAVVHVSSAAGGSDAALLQIGQQNTPGLLLAGAGGGAAAATYIAGGDSGGPAIGPNGEVLGMITSGSAHAGGQNRMVSAGELSQLLSGAGVANRQGPVDTAFADALRLYDAGQYDAALARLNEVTALYPQHAGATRWWPTIQSAILAQGPVTEPPPTEEPPPPVPPTQSTETIDQQPPEEPPAPPEPTREPTVQPPPPAPVTFTSTAVVTVPSVPAGGSVLVTATVGASAATNALVYLEVNDPNGNVVFQQWWPDQSFVAGQPLTFSANWQLPSSANVGNYAVHVGIYSPDGLNRYAWTKNAAQFAVSVPPPAPTPAPPPPAPPVFTTAASFANRIVPAGETLAISATVTSTTATQALVDVEVYDKAGARVFQQWWDNQTFAAGQQVTYNTTWQVPSTTAAGDYTVAVGMFGPGWTPQYSWNAGAAQFSVTAPEAPPPPPTQQTGEPTVPPTQVTNPPPTQQAPTQQAGEETSGWTWFVRGVAVFVLIAAIVVLFFTIRGGRGPGGMPRLPHQRGSAVH